MYQFKKEKYTDGSWKFELDGISLIVYGFIQRGQYHFLERPDKAIGFFYMNNNLYGVSNQLTGCKTAEEFYDLMCEQHLIFDPAHPIKPGHMVGGNRTGQSNFGQASNY